MGFCSASDDLEVMRQAPEPERMLVRSGLRLFKHWFSVTREEQARRFKAGETDPLIVGSTAHAIGASTHILGQDPAPGTAAERHALKAGGAAREEPCPSRTPPFSARARGSRVPARCALLRRRAAPPPSPPWRCARPRSRRLVSCP